MNPGLSPAASQHHPKIEVRTWYLIGLVGVVTTLLLLGEYSSFKLPATGQLPSGVNQKETAFDSGESHVLNHRSGDHLAAVREM